jgi:hypothetical protein
MHGKCPSRRLAIMMRHTTTADFYGLQLVCIEKVVEAGTADATQVLACMLSRGQCGLHLNDLEGTNLRHGVYLRSMFTERSLAVSICGNARSDFRGVGDYAERFREERFRGRPGAVHDGSPISRASSDQICSKAFKLMPQPSLVSSSK